MKIFALSTVLVLGISAAAPVFGSTTVYNSKAPAIVRVSDVSSNAMAFDGRSTNSKLGSSRSGTVSIDVMAATFRNECTKCSS